jgi:hypothetical protein
MSPAIPLETKTQFAGLGAQRATRHLPRFVENLEIAGAML